MVIEIRALLGGMTLSNIDALSRDDARRLSPQEVDPIDEERRRPRRQRPRPGRRRSREARAIPWSTPRRSAASRPPHPRGLGRGGRRGAVRRALAAGRGRQARRHRRSPRPASAARPSPVRWATSSLRCPRTGISPRPDSNRRASGVSPPAGFLPVGGAPVSYPRRSSCNSHPASAYRSPLLRSNHPLSDDQIRTVAPSIFADTRTKAAPSGTATSPRRLC